MSKYRFRCTKNIFTSFGFKFLFKMKKRQLNPAFRGRGRGKEDTNDVSDALLRQARRSGQLNLSNRGLTEVPQKVWRINTDVPEEAKSVSLDNTDDKWWDQVDLTKLILASNALTSLAPEISNLPALEALDIHDNSLEELPDEIATLENLKRINLSHNKLSLLPANFGSLTSLRSLKLEHNSLTSVGECLGALVQLEELDISNNDLNELPPNISRLHNLRNLNLCNNALESLPAEIGQLSVLEDINVSNNKITRIPEDVGKLKSLKRLDCRQNQLTEVPSLVKCPSLKELYLGKNKITRLEAHQLMGYPSLAVLDLRDNRIGSVPDEITVLEELERIDLSNNDLSSLPFTMGTMQHLKAIALEGNPLKRLRRDVVMRGTQAILKYLKSRIEVEEKPPATTDQVDSKVIPDRPAVSFAAPSADIDLHTMTQTKTLIYSGKKLAEIPEAVIQGAVTSKVNTIDLSKNMLTQLPQGMGDLSGSLSDLNMGFNRLATLSDDVSCFVKLQFLDLRNNQLSGLPGSMSALVCLREIILSYNKLGSLPSVVYSIPSIRTILASDNQIGAIDVNGLLRLSVLETLDLQNNNISQVPPELGNVATLRSLQLGGNSFRNPRNAVLAKGTPALLEYLRSRIPT